jgi:Co/Zn/Cd efflux system component
VPVPQWLSRKQPTRKMSFGFHRAEMLGALGSVLIIWALTAMLLYSAIDRVFNPTGGVACASALTMTFPRRGERQTHVHPCLHRPV